MSEFEVSVDGLEETKAELDALLEQVDSDAVFRVSSGAEYSVFLEFGTEHMPPYPFFRPALREFRANPEAFLLRNTQFSDLGEIKDGDELVEAIALALESQIKTNATASATDRSPGTDADHPQVQTGNLRAGIKARRVK